MTIFTFTKQVSNADSVPGETAPSQTEDIAPSGAASEKLLDPKVNVPAVAVTPIDHCRRGLFLYTSLGPYPDSDVHVKCPGCGAGCVVGTYSAQEYRILVHADPSCPIARRAFEAVSCSNDMVERCDVAHLPPLRADCLEYERCSESNWVVSYRVPDVPGVALRLKLRDEAARPPMSFECEVRLGTKSEFETIADGTLIQLFYPDRDHDARLSNYMRLPQGWRDEFLAMAELWATVLKLMEL
jgi:hypothetical protein